MAFRRPIFTSETTETCYYAIHCVRIRVAHLIIPRKRLQYLSDLSNFEQLLTDNGFQFHVNLSLTFGEFRFLKLVVENCGFHYGKLAIDGHSLRHILRVFFA